MKYMFLSLFFLLAMTSGIFAGVPRPISQNLQVYKDLKISFKYEQSESNTDKLLVKITFVDAKGSDPLGGVYLRVNKKNQNLKPEIKDGIVTITFEVDKKDTKETDLFFSYQNDSNCPPAYILNLKNLIDNEKGE